MEKEYLLTDDGFEFDLETPDEEVKEESDEIEADEVEETTEAETVENEEVKEDKPKIKGKYLHEEFEYDYDDPEVQTLLQKGKNHDRIQEKLQTLESDPRLSEADAIRDIAKKYDMTPTKLIDTLLNQYYQSVADEKGVEVDSVKYKAELDAKEKALAEKESKLTETERQKQEQEKANADMYARFIAKYPNVVAENIAKETWDKVNAGEDLLIAYQNQLIKEQEDKLKQLEQQKDIKKKSPIKSTTENGIKPKDDDWGAIFDQV